MLVRLYDMPVIDVEGQLAAEGVAIKRAMPLDKTKVLEFVGANFSQNWVNECEFALTNQPSSCYIAVRDKKVVGFACYDATALGFFGPTGVAESERGRGIGKALLWRCLVSMKEKGYGYCIIGWVGDALGFYEKAVNAKAIDGATPERSVYSNMVDR